ELREQNKLLQRQLAYSLDIDTPLYSKIERGDRRAKKEQVALLANLFGVDEKELMTLWLASQIQELIKDNANAIEALEYVLNFNRE
ncbi:MAG: helix-turn-helix transcriptional regulator, partial [Bacteroidales bacterium]